MIACSHKERGGCHTSSAGRVAINRSGTESPSRSGSNTAWDSMFFSWMNHKFFPGERKETSVTMFEYHRGGCPYPLTSLRERNSAQT